MIRAIPDLLTTGAVAPRAAARAAPDSQPGAFATVLKSRLELRSDVRFSAHALRRLDDRDIRLTDQDHARIRDAVDQLGAKGGRESLVLMDKLALVINVRNRTVITAVPTDELDSSVFTQIDSAVVVGSPAAVAPMETMS